MKSVASSRGRAVNTTGLWMSKEDGSRVSFGPQPSCRQECPGDQNCKNSPNYNPKQCQVDCGSGVKPPLTAEKDACTTTRRFLPLNSNFQVPSCREVQKSWAAPFLPFGQRERNIRKSQPDFVVFAKVCQVFSNTLEGPRIYMYWPDRSRGSDKRSVTSEKGNCKKFLPNCGSKMVCDPEFGCSL